MPAVLAAARQNLKNPPRVHTETAIRRIRGTINLIMDELQPFLEKVPRSAAASSPARAPGPSPPWKTTGAGSRRSCCRARTATSAWAMTLYRKKLRYSLASDHHARGDPGRAPSGI